jgi:ABC-type amino acid transport substrate-binding protein
VPYTSSGFALASLVQRKTLNCQSALFSPHFINTGLVIFIMMMMSAWVMHAAESVPRGGNPDFPALLSSVYWSITTMTTVGFGDIVPSSALGRCVTAIWSVASYLGVSTLTAILTTVLTSDSLRLDTVDTLASVLGALCIEKDYPLLEDYLSRDPSAPNKITRDTIGACMAALQDGSVRAVMTDRSILTWYASAYGLSSLHVSPALSDNPLSFVFANTSLLRAYTNPAVMASRTHPDWVPLSTAINVFYFGTQVEGALDAEPVAVDTKLIVGSVLLTAATLAAHVLQACGGAAWLRAQLAERWKRSAAGKRVSKWGGRDGGGASGGAPLALPADTAAGADCATWDAAAAGEPPGTPTRDGSLLAALVEEARDAAAAHAEALAAAASTGQRVAALQEHIGVIALSGSDGGSFGTPRAAAGSRNSRLHSRAALLEQAARTFGSGGNRGARGSGSGDGGPSAGAGPAPPGPPVAAQELTSVSVAASR